MNSHEFALNWDEFGWIGSHVDVRLSRLDDVADVRAEHRKLKEALAEDGGAAAEVVAAQRAVLHAQREVRVARVGPHGGEQHVTTGHAGDHAEQDGKAGQQPSGLLVEPTEIRDARPRLSFFIFFSSFFHLFSSSFSRAEWPQDVVQQHRDAAHHADGLGAKLEAVHAPQPTLFLRRRSLCEVLRCWTRALHGSGAICEKGQGSARALRRAPHL